MTVDNGSLLTGEETTEEEVENAVFQIRIPMVPSFFAAPDPDFKNPEPDPSGFCFDKLIGSK